MSSAFPSLFQVHQSGLQRGQCVGVSNLDNAILVLIGVGPELVVRPGSGWPWGGRFKISLCDYTQLSGQGMLLGLRLGLGSGVGLGLGFGLGLRMCN